MNQLNIKNKIFLAIFFLLIPLFSLLFFPKNINSHEVFINLGKFTKDTLQELIEASHQIGTPGKQVDYISRRFLGTKYGANTLIGNDKTIEVLTLNLKEIDCFTLIDYVESIRISKDYSEIIPNLIRIRYKKGVVDYKNRRHFFSDWAFSEFKHVIDVTNEVSEGKAVKAIKHLNKKANGSFYLPGIETITREITYIPTNKIDKKIISKLKTGDYIGIYSNDPGLDVSHTGILIFKSKTPYIRHASSRKGKNRVVDENLLRYLRNKPGIVILRPVRVTN